MAWHDVGRAAALPAVVREGLVGLRHPVRVLLLLDRAAAAVGGVEHLAGEPLDHGLLGTRARVLDEPAHARATSRRCGRTSTGTW